MNTGQAIKQIKQILETEPCFHPFYDSLEMAIDALREKAERENPKPLTLEQLKERVGKPVYCDDEDCGWGVVGNEGRLDNKWHLSFWFPKIIGWVGWSRLSTANFYDHEPKEAR